MRKTPKYKITEGRVTLPLGALGILLTTLSRADVLPFLPTALQPYILGAAALAIALGIIDITEQRKPSEETKHHDAEPF